MIAFPATAAGIAILCAALVGWDAYQRPRPERLIWTIAFLVFAVAAASEVIGLAAGWNPALARLYYLAGAVLVVGVLALGELYLLLPGRMPAYVTGLSLLVVAVAATAVWSAPIDVSRLPADGWHALERGPFLIALAATINVGGTLILVGGALYSAWKLKAAAGSGRRAAGCLAIAVGTIVVALGGTMTRFGRSEYLYLAMSLGMAIIFAGVILTRSSGAPQIHRSAETTMRVDAALRPARLIPLPSRQRPEMSAAAVNQGIHFVVERLLPLADVEIARACQRWSAMPVDGDVLSREQAREVWGLRLGLPATARPRFDALPLGVQAQLAEIYAEVWSLTIPDARRERGA